MGAMNSPDGISNEEETTSGSKKSKAKSAKRAKKKPVKYVKAPQAPRRFKSAFIFYTEERHKTIRVKLVEAEGGGDKTPDVAKLVSAEWRNLTSEERAPFEEFARRDKKRFEVEKSMYTGPWKIPAKKRSQKDPSAPKRPMSSFLSFSNAKRAELKHKNPGMTNTEASKVLAKMWRDASEEEKREHIEREAKLREIYKVEMAEWRERKKKEEDEHRRKREEMALNIIDSEANQDAEMPPGIENDLNSKAASATENTFPSIGYGHGYQEQTVEQIPYQQGPHMYATSGPHKMYSHHQHSHGPSSSASHSAVAPFPYVSQPPSWQGPPHDYQTHVSNGPGQSYAHEDEGSQRKEMASNFMDSKAGRDTRISFESKSNLHNGMASMHENTFANSGFGQSYHEPGGEQQPYQQGPPMLPTAHPTSGPHMMYSHHQHSYVPPPSTGAQYSYPGQPTPWQGPPADHYTNTPNASGQGYYPPVYGGGTAQGPNFGSPQHVAIHKSQQTHLPHGASGYSHNPYPQEEKINHYSQVSHEEQTGSDQYSPTHAQFPPRHLSGDSRYDAFNSMPPYAQDTQSADEFKSNGDGGPDCIRARQS